MKKVFSAIWSGYIRLEILSGSSPDKVIPFIENSLIEARPLYKILRLICLHSLVTNGLKSIVIQTYRKLVIQSYGIEELALWTRLQLAGLIKEEGSDRLTVNQIVSLQNILVQVYPDQFYQRKSTNEIG